MIQHNPTTYTPDTAGDTIQYKPLSLLAVAGLIVAGLFAVILLVNAGAAFFKGEPFFLGGVVIGVALCGAVLSGLGLWQVITSEGTRAGAAIAKWGLGISIVGGLGYFTYEKSTELAILQQANRFLMEQDEHSGFFPRLQGGETDVRTAFLYSLDPSDRGARPDNPVDMERLDFPQGQNPKGKLTQFLESPLIRLIRSGGKTVTVEPLAVREWNYEAGAYRVVRTYRIATDEATYEVAVPVSSIEPAAAGDKRRWKVDLDKPLAIEAVQPTKLGVQRHGLRQGAFEFLNDKTGWFGKLKGALEDFDVYLETQPPAARKGLVERAFAIRSRTPLIALGGTAWPPLNAKADQELMARLLPGYRPIGSFSGYVTTDKMRFWDPKLLPNVQMAFKQALSPAELPRLLLKVIEDDYAPCEVKDGEVQVTLQTEIVVRTVDAKGEPMIVVVLLQVVVAAPAGLDPANAQSGQEWRMKSAEALRALPMPRQQ